MVILILTNNRRPFKIKGKHILLQYNSGKKKNNLSTNC